MTDKKKVYLFYYGKRKVLERMKRRAVIFAVAGMLAVTSLAGCSKIKESDVVVSAGDEKITATEANFYARYMQAQYETYYGSYLGDNMWATEASEGKRTEEHGCSERAHG